MGFKIFQFPFEQPLSIPLGNTKMGAIPSTSFPPIITCPTDIPCISECYALAYLKRYPVVRNAYMRNYELYKTDSVMYWQQLSYFLQTKKPKMFRYMVSGDIPDIDYLHRMVAIAHRFEDTIFTVYTKQYEFLKGTGVPKNLIIMVSAWADFPIPNFILNNHRIAWLDVPRETRYTTRQYVACKKSCFTCRICYNPNDERDVLLYKH